MDWYTQRPALARVLTTLDSMQTMVLGFMGEVEMAEQEQLKVLAEMASEARIEMDFVAAEVTNAYPVDLQTGWSMVEAYELLTGLRELAIEARDAMRHQHLDEMPEMVTLDLAENLRRIKLLLAGIEEIPIQRMARA